MDRARCDGRFLARTLGPFVMMPGPHSYIARRSRSQIRNLPSTTPYDAVLDNTPGRSGHGMFHRRLVLNGPVTGVVVHQ
jgi:hypothetical protein